MLRPALMLPVMILFLMAILSPIAGAQEFGAPVHLQKDVHFLAADGSIALMKAGNYVLEQDGLNLRLWSASGGESLLLKTTIMTHKKNVAGPAALSIEGAGEYPDLHMMVLLMPAGEGLRGLGTYSGVMPRGNIWDDFTDVVDDITDPIGDVVEDVVEDVADGVSDGADWVADQVEDAADAAMDLAINTFEEVGPASLNMIEEAGDLYQQAQDLAYEAATNPDLASELLSQAAELAEQAAAQTAQALEDSWDAAVDAATWLYDQADRYLQEIMCKAMVYIFQGMDILADLAGPAAAALSEALAPVNAVVEDAVNEAVERVGAQDAIDQIPGILMAGADELVPQFAVLANMLGEVSYSYQRLEEFKDLVLSPSVCELSSSELESRVGDILNPLHARLVQLTGQAEIAYADYSPPPASTGEEEDEAIDPVLPEPLPFTLETVASNSHPPIPAGLKATFLNEEGTGGSTTCQVVKYGNLDCWAYSFTDNRLAFGVVAYDKEGKVVEQWEKRGARYLSRVVLHPESRTVEFVGQGGLSVQMGWDEIIAVNPPDVAPPDQEVVIQDRPTEMTDPVPPAPPQELEDTPVVTEEPQKDPEVAEVVPPAPPVDMGDVPESGDEVFTGPEVPDVEAPKVEETELPTEIPDPTVATAPPTPTKVEEEPKTIWKSSLRPRRRGEDEFIDQSWTPRTRDGQDLRAGVTLGQTFIAGKDGLLSGIALRINRRAWTSSNLVVDIRSVDEKGRPSTKAGSPLYSVSLSSGAFPLAYSETMVQLNVKSAGIWVKEGETLAVTATNRGTDTYTWWNQEGYEGGKGLVLDRGEWREIEGDLVFQTEIDPNAPEISSRGVTPPGPLTTTDPYVQVDFVNSHFDYAKGRPVTDELENPLVPAGGGYRDICIGDERDILGVTVHRSDDELSGPVYGISIEVYESRADLDAGRPVFDSRETDEPVSANSWVLFDLRNRSHEGRYVRVRTTGNHVFLDKVEVWSTREWKSGYAGVQLSGSGFLTVLHPSLKPVAMSVGFGFGLPCLNKVTAFGAGLTTGDPNVEIGVQFGLTRTCPDPDTDPATISISIEFEIPSGDSPVPQLFVTSPEGEVRDLIPPSLYVTSPEGTMTDLQTGEVVPEGGSHLAMHVDVQLAPDLLWEIMKSPFVSNGDTCDLYKDVIQGIIITIGKEYEPSVSTSVMELTAMYSYSWNWLFGL